MLTSAYVLTHRAFLSYGSSFNWHGVRHDLLRGNKLFSSTESLKEKSADAASTPSPESMERFLQMAESGHLGFDPWAQRLSLLDLHVPTPLSALPKATSLRTKLKFLRHGLENRISNATTMFRIARNRSFPWNPKLKPYSPKIFQTTSTKPGTWLEPLREITLDSYKHINAAVATNDINAVRRLTVGAYKQRVLARIKALHAVAPTRSPKKTPPRITHTWRLQSLASPVRCVSIRGQQAHLGRTEPLFGTRWVVQACMRFDTWQSLATYSPTSSSVPEPKRVLEYLVFEKRMWYDEPWVVRDQLWEGQLGDYRSS